MKNSLHKSFTLIELLVVIFILGILSSIVLVSFQGIRPKVRDSKRKADLTQIKLALELDFQDDDKYTESRTMPVKIPCSNPPACTGPQDGIYMDPVPQDPKGFPYGWLDNTGEAGNGCTDQNYVVYAELESEEGFWVISEKGQKILEDEPDRFPPW